MEMTRRYWLVQSSRFLLLGTPAAIAFLEANDAKKEAAVPDSYRMADHWWAMLIDIEKCIGCGNCVRACADENVVPEGYFRTWIERYVSEWQMGWSRRRWILLMAASMVFLPRRFQPRAKAFFVPKMCNHCADSPCTQVCPVGATFVTPDGVVLVDRNTAWAAVTACKRARMAAGSSTPRPTRPKSAHCATTASPVASRLPVARFVPTAARKLADLKNPKDPIHEFLRNNPFRF